MTTIQAHSGDNFARLVKSVSELTATNHHTESLIAIVEYFIGDPASKFLFADEFDKLQEDLDGIRYQHERRGSITPQLIEHRREVYHAILHRLKTILSPAEYDLIHQAL